jgi:hypothetical protein
MSSAHPGLRIAVKIEADEQNLEIQLQSKIFIWHLTK